MPADYVTISLRMPKWLHAQIKETADEQLRSFNSQALVLLAETLKERAMKKTQPKQ